MSDQNYPQPVMRMVTLGEPLGENWPDYPAQYGLTAEHIPDLINMAVDPSCWDEDEDEASDVPPEFYAHIHAWRALGQLGAIEAIPSLINVFDWVDTYDDEWAMEDLSRAFGFFGAAAIPALSDWLADPAHGRWSRSAVTNALDFIVKANPETGLECAAALARTLAAYAQNDPDVNASIVVVLSHLRQPSTYALVEEAYLAGRVELGMMGDWEDFQVTVGLLEKRITELQYGWSEARKEALSDEEKIISSAIKKTDNKEKNKRKQEKQSRKQNRKKKKK